MDENANNPQKNNSYIIPVYQISKEYIIHTYFILLKNYCSCRNRLICRNAVDNTELNEWRNSVRSIYLQLREEEAEYNKKYDWRKVEEILENTDYIKLVEFTEETLKLKALQEIRGISMSNNKDPVKEYIKEAYGVFD